MNYYNPQSAPAPEEETVLLPSGKRRQAGRSGPMSMFRRHVRMLILLLLGYLTQVCIMPYVSIGGVTPSVIFPIIAVITVGFGRIRAFWAGAFYGIVLEVMQPTVALMNLIMYPASALLCSVMLADKRPQQLEYERSLGRAGRNISPLVRTPICAMLLTLIYDGLNLIYIYLRGNTPTLTSFGRGVLDVVLTTLLTLLLMIPLRRFLGFRAERAVAAAPKRYDLYRSRRVPDGESAPQENAPQDGSPQSSEEPH